MHSNKRQKEGPEGNHDFCLLNAWFTSWKAWVYLFRTSIFCWPCSPFSTTSHNLSLFYFCIHGSKPENIKSMHIWSHLTSIGEGTNEMLRTQKKRGLYMVEHPGTGLKACETESPRSTQRNKAASSSEFPRCPNFFSRAVMKSEGCDTFTWLGSHRSYQSARNVKQSFCISYLLPRSLHCSVEGHSLWVSI